MSAVVIILLVLPILVAVIGLIYVLHKRFPGGIVAAATADEDTLFVATGAAGDNEAPHYKLREKKDDVGKFRMVGVEPDPLDDEDDDADEADEADEADAADDADEADDLVNSTIAPEATADETTTGDP